MSQAEGGPQSVPAPDELQALGSVIQAASRFEHALGQAFCALLGSKYAAILVSNRTSAQLIDECRALVKAQRELEEPAKAAIAAALNNCTEANRKRNRLVHDMWASGPDGVSHLLRREKSGYDLATRPITVPEIHATANDLTSSAVQLDLAISDNLGPGRSTLEAQLRWEDAVAQMTPSERISLLQHRLAGMLGEMARLLARYNEESWASWANETAEVVKSTPEQGLRIIEDKYAQGEIFSVVLGGKPTEPVPTWLKEQDPNMQLATAREQIQQLTKYLLSPSQDRDTSE